MTRPSSADSSERWAERGVLAAFGLTMLTGVALLGLYLLGGNTQLEGVLLALCLGSLGVGIVLWGQLLIPGPVEVEPREDLASPSVADLDEIILEEAGFTRRTLLVRALGGAVAGLAAALAIPVFSLGPAPGRSLFETTWRSGARLATAGGEPVSGDALPVGGVVTVFPNGDDDDPNAATLLVHVEPELLRLGDEAATWAPDGFVAYSKICTHAGCPVGLYRNEQHVLICPCHQSEFAVLNGAVPISGPAARPLPQLPIQRAPDGTFVALGDYREPVGPSFWNMELGEGGMMDRLRPHRTPPSAMEPPPGAPPSPVVGAAGERRTELERALSWLDSRTGVGHVLRSTLRKVFPDHWSFLLGEIALFCFVILVATGVFLTFFYQPSAAELVYDGEYAPLRGAEVSAAYASVLDISFDVRAGLLMRQIHHWTALVFVAITILHLCRIFFTGAFRRPREINWLVGFTMLSLALALGLTGYTLPDDLLSGTGARITYSAALSIPFIGPWVASLVFGGEFPTTAFISRFFVLHVLLLPALFVGLITIHLGLIVLQKHTQYRGGRAREDNVVGRYFWPGQAFLSTGLFFLTAAAVALFGGLFQINPIWVYGPFDAAVVSSPAQPDWYVGWLDGSLRIFPPFEPTILGVTIPAAFIPGIVIPGIVLTIVALWPFIEARVTGDHEPHHLLDRFWEHPVRTATGIAILAFFGVLTLAGGNDVLAFYFGTEVETLTLLFRGLAVALPIVLWLVTWRVCRARLAMSRSGVAPAPTRHGGVALRRQPDGGFEEVEP